ncbi:MAG: methionyl-tRNA formyltransferase, partial [Litorimonas sp.]
DDTAATLSDRLSRVGAGMWPRVLGAVERGAVTPTPQAGEPTYAHKIDKAEARLDWMRPAVELERRVRGLAPFPGAWCEIAGKRVKVHLARVEPVPAQSGTARPGEVLDDDLLIACGEDALRLLSVQPAGKGKMDAGAFNQGARVAKCDILS